MQFHEKKIDLFDFMSFLFAWTFLNFLARCGNLKIENTYNFQQNLKLYYSPALFKLKIH